MKYRRVLSWALIAWLSTTFASNQIVLAQEANLPNFGFSGLEIFKLEKRSQSMVPGDFNADGLRDLVLVDNSHSRLDLLLQRKAKPDKPDAIDKSDVNAVQYDWRFEHEKVPVDQEVTSVAVGDFNGDGKDDIAYFGVPDRLVIRVQSEKDSWSELLNLRLPDVSESSWLMAAGDLNHDDRTDLVVMGKTETYLLYQTDAGTLGTPTRLMNTSNKMALAHIGDMDGDGLNDLCYTADDDGNRALCVRIQTADGRLGPELTFDLHRPRSVTFGEFDGKPGTEVLVVDSRTNRVNVWKLATPDAESEQSFSRVIQYGFGESGSGRDREMATGDIDGDDKTDVVVTDPSAARVLVFRQRNRDGLDSGTTFPSLVGSTQVRIAKFGDTAQVLLLSPQEKTLGICQFREGRLSFPTALPIETDPLAFEVTDLNGDSVPEVVYLRETGSSRKYEFRGLQFVKGEWKAFKWGEEETFEFSLSSEPERLTAFDANRDGRLDYLVFFGGGRTPALLLTNDKGIPELTETIGGIQLGDVSRGSVFFPESTETKESPTGAILAARDAFARELVLNKSQQWEVLDQYNASESTARIEGVASLNLDDDPGNEVVLVDSGIKKLRFLKRNDALYERWKELDLGPIRFVSTQVADLNGDKKEDLLIFGRSRLGVVYTGRSTIGLKRIASYETKLDNVYFTDVAIGDVNGDKKMDLAVIDTREHYLEVVTREGESELKHALHFRIFEEKSFSRSGAPGNEPRESLVVDVTGDGKSDLILLAHDRVLLYPQDDGE